jgi:hypothetical protein
VPTPQATTSFLGKGTQALSLGEESGKKWWASVRPQGVGLVLLRL